MDKQSLIDFEDNIASLFNEGEIPYPVHLSNGNEDQLIEIFKSIKEDDWVCGSWRMHYQCLLHGVTPEELKKSIMDGNSISLCFPERRIISSAIVGGILPIALGIAMNTKGHVHCFLGDMTSELGIFHECVKYAQNFNLPISWYIEDNDMSVCTPTKKVWGIKRYIYKSKWPHAGAGQRVQF